MDAPKAEINILYRDEHLLVVYKPYGVLSESDEYKPNMPALLQDEIGCEDIYTVHRLDRTTQGLMLYALTAEAAKRLSEAVQKGEVEKIYLAVVEGVPKTPAGELSDLLYFDRKKNKSYVVKRERKGVKEARLQYETLQTAERGGKTLSLLTIRLMTGRTHQIRVQFASRKMPLVGDRRYGSTVRSDNILLCSSQLRFTHPFSGEELQVSYLPDNDAFKCFDMPKLTSSK